MNVAFPADQLVDVFILCNWSQSVTQDSKGSSEMLCVQLVQPLFTFPGWGASQIPGYGALWRHCSSPVRQQERRALDSLTAPCCCFVDRTCSVDQHELQLERSQGVKHGRRLFAECTRIIHVTMYIRCMYDIYIYAFVHSQYITIYHNISIKNN